MSYTLTATGSGIVVISGPHGNSLLDTGSTGFGLYGPTVMPQGNAAKLMAVVCQSSASNSDPAWLAGEGSIGGTIDQDFIFLPFFANDPFLNLGSGGSQGINSGLGQDTNLHIVVGLHTGATNRQFQDGVETANSPLARALNTTHGGNFGLAIHGNDLTSIPYAGQIGDVILLSTIPSNLAGFLSDLAAKWSSGAAFNAFSYGATVLFWMDPNQGVVTSGGNVQTWTSRSNTIPDGATNVPSLINVKARYPERIGGTIPDGATNVPSLIDIRHYRGTL